jgi:anti-anti-sigma factor
MRVRAPAEIAVELRGDVVLAHVGGEVDMTNAAYVRDELVRSVPNEAPGLVVDLSECRYLDSAAIAVLFELARRLDRRRQELRLTLPPPSPLRRVLVLTEMHTVAPLHDTLDEAVAAIG